MILSDLEFERRQKRFFSEQATRLRLRGGADAERLADSCEECMLLCDFQILKGEKQMLDLNDAVGDYCAHIADGGERDAGYFARISFYP